MERIQQLLPQPESFTLTQRELLAENRLLRLGKVDGVPPLGVRFHHMWHYGALAETWMREVCWYIRKLQPWDFRDHDIFFERAMKFALAQTDRWYFNTLHDHFPLPMGRDEYLQEIFGSSEQERNLAMTSDYLWRLNFLLRAHACPEYPVVFSRQPDHICFSCRGGIEGAGPHCLLPAKPGGDDDQVSHMLEELSNSSSLVKLRRDGAFEIPIGLFFNLRFMAGVWTY